MFACGRFLLQAPARDAACHEMSGACLPHGHISIPPDRGKQPRKPDTPPVTEISSNPLDVGNVLMFTGVSGSRKPFDTLQS